MPSPKLVTIAEAIDTLEFSSDAVVDVRNSGGDDPADAGFKEELSRGSVLNTEVRLHAARCCCGLVRYHVPTAVVQELQAIHTKQTKPAMIQGRWSWIDKVEVNMTFGLLIFLNSAGIGLDTMISDEDGGSHPLMIVLESLFLIAFWIEITLRILAHGWRHYCTDAWGPFDFGVTLLGTVDAWVLTPIMGGNAAMSGVSALRTLRLLRLFRLIRVFRAFSELSRLVKVLIGAFHSLTWVTLLLFALTYVSCILVRILLEKNQNDTDDLSRLTDTIPWTLFYHVTLITAEGHLDFLVKPTVEITDLWYIYWVLLIVFFNFFMVNLMVGIIVQRTLANCKDEDAEQSIFVNETAQFKRTLMTLFLDRDIDQVISGGPISVDVIVELMGEPTMSHIMSTFGMKTDLPKEFLLSLMGFQNKRFVTFNEFYESCVRICGASKDIRAFMLQFDVSSLQKEVMERMGLLEKRVGYIEPKDSALSPGEAEINRLIQACDRKKQLLPVARSSSPSNGPKGSAKKFVCKASLGGGFGERVESLLLVAQKRLKAMERRQEETLLSLSELRVTTFGASHWAVTCCKNDHPLMPLGTSLEPVGSCEYRHWTCDSAGDPSGCRHGRFPGSHLSKLRRYHCQICRYDLCEDCYNALQSQRGFVNLSKSSVDDQASCASPAPTLLSSCMQLSLPEPPPERCDTMETPTSGGN